MKLTTIVANNGEPLEFRDRSKENGKVDKIKRLIDGAVKDSTEVLLYGTELSDDDVLKLDKTLPGWHGFIKETGTGNYSVAYGSGEKVIFDDKRYLSLKGEKNTIDGVMAFSNNGSNSYAGTMQHLSQRKLHELSECILAAKVALNSRKDSEGLIISDKEFHTGYLDIYRNTFLNFLLQGSKIGQLPQEKLVELISKAGLYPIANMEGYTYDTHKFKLPTHFEGIHTFVGKSLRNSSAVEIIKSEGNSRPTVISRMEW